MVGILSKTGNQFAGWRELGGYIRQALGKNVLTLHCQSSAGPDGGSSFSATAVPMRLHEGEQAPPPRKILREFGQYGLTPELDMRAGLGICESGPRELIFRQSAP
jgi:hypothetical protein